MFSSRFRCAAPVINSDLPYPEGVAAAEVLRVGSGTRGETKDDTGEARQGLVAVMLGSVASAGLAIITATRVAAAEVTGFFRLGVTASTGYNIAWSLALLGAGHLVGLSVGMAMLTGLIISWAIAVPILTSMTPAAAGVTLAAHTTTIWRTEVRFIGAGAIAIAAIYTLAKLAKPVVGGLVSTLVASKAKNVGDDLDRDIAPQWIYLLTAACLIIAAYLAYTFASSTVLAPNATTLTLIAVPFVLLGGFLIAGICGYMAGLIGASNSPISGVGILFIVLCASALVVAVHPTAETRPALVAFALFITAIVFACATILNDNLQDLKTGQLVGASPMRTADRAHRRRGRRRGGDSLRAQPAGQGVRLRRRAERQRGFAESASRAAGHADFRARPGRDRRQPQLEDARHRRGGRRGTRSARRGFPGVAHKLRIPPLAVGIGIYLPMSATFAVVVGAVISHWYDKRARTMPNPNGPSDWAR